MGKAKHSSEKGTGRSFPRPFSLLCFALPILPFLSQTFRVQPDTEFPWSPIMNLVRLGNVILVLILSLGFKVYPSVGIYVCQIKGIDVAKMRLKIVILSVSGSQYCLLKNPQEWIVPVKVDLFVIKPMCDGEKRSK